MPEPEQRAELYTALLGVEQVQGEEREQVSRLGLDAALAIWNEWDRAWALAALAGRLEGALLERALATLTIEDERPRAWVLGKLADRLGGKRQQEVLSQALDAALAIEDERYRSEALAALADKLEGVLLKRALDAALAIEFARFRADALGALAGKLEEKQRLEALVTHLLRLEYEMRKAVLRTLSFSDLFAPPVTPEIVDEIARSVVEICAEWRGQ